MKRMILSAGLMGVLVGLGAMPASAEASYADYPLQLELSLSISNLDYRRGSFNQIVERFRDIPENGELKWLHYRSTELPRYDLDVWVTKAGRDDGRAKADISFENKLFVSLDGTGTPYNVDTDLGFKRFRTRGEAEWFPAKWLKVYGARSEEDKTGLRSESEAVGQKAKTTTWGATLNLAPAFLAIDGISEDLVETEFGNSMNYVEYLAQYQPGSRLLLTAGGSTAGLDSRRRSGPPASDASLNTTSLSATYDLNDYWTVDLGYHGVDYGDENDGGLDVRSTRVSGAISYYFAGGMVEVYGTSEDRDYKGADITGQEIRASGIRARYRYKQFQINAFYDSESRDTSGISNVHLTNTEDLPLQSRISGLTLSGTPFSSLMVQYQFRLVENNYNRVDVVGVDLHKFFDQSLTLTYPLTSKVGLSYTFTDIEFLSRGERYFISEGSEIRTIQLVENTEYHQVYLDLNLGNTWDAGFGYGISRTGAAEEFDPNKVKSYGYEATLRHYVSDNAWLSLRWVYDGYQDKLQLSPIGNANWVELWTTLRI